MKSWPLLVILCVSAYLLGYTVKLSWGGFFFLAYAAISIGLACLSGAMALRTGSSWLLALCLGVVFIEAAAATVMVSATLHYYSYDSDHLSWYYNNWAWVLDLLAALEAALLIVHPIIWACRGIIARIYRGILSRLAGYLLVGYGCSVPMAGLIWPQMQSLRGEEL